MAYTSGAFRAKAISKGCGKRNAMAYISSPITLSNLNAQDYFIYMDIDESKTSLLEVPFQRMFSAKDTFYGFL